MLLAAGLQWVWDQAEQKWMMPADEATQSTGLLYSYRNSAFNDWYEPYCEFAVMLRPIIIGFAWLSAGLMLVGVARRSS